MHNILLHVCSQYLFWLKKKNWSQFFWQIHPGFYLSSKSLWRSQTFLSLIAAKLIFLHHIFLMLPDIYSMDYLSTSSKTAHAYLRLINCIYVLLFIPCCSRARFLNESTAWSKVSQRLKLRLQSSYCPRDASCSSCCFWVSGFFGAGFSFLQRWRRDEWEWACCWFCAGSFWCFAALLLKIG